MGRSSGQINSAIRDIIVLMLMLIISTLIIREMINILSMGELYGRSRYTRIMNTINIAFL